MAEMTGTTGNIQYGPCQVTFDGTDLGFFKGGVQAVYEQGILDIEVDQSSMIVDKRVQTERMTVTVNMVENTIATLTALLPTGTATTDGTKKKLEFGGSQVSYSDAAQLIITPTSDVGGTLDTDSNLKLTVYLAFPQVQFSMAFNRDDVRVIPVEFHGLRDSTKDSGKQLFVWGDTTAT